MDTAQWTREIHNLCRDIGLRYLYVVEAQRPHNHRLEWIDGTIRTFGLWY